jgi:hypothetical protein
MSVDRLDSVEAVVSAKRALKSGHRQHVFCRHCPEDEKRIGDFIVAGHGLLIRQGKSRSLLELTEGVAKMLDTAQANGITPTTPATSA